jgi:hypothetical protein
VASKLAGMWKEVIDRFFGLKSTHLFYSLTPRSIVKETDP